MTESVTGPIKEPPQFTVLYDGGCPLCSRDGELLSGARAFLALWAELPGWRSLAMAGRLPGTAWTMELSYRLFLRWRPTLQRWAFRLDQRGPERTGQDRPSAHDNAPR